jgi:hypothetical protein
MMMPHRVCPACGFYKGRSVVKKDEQAETGTSS